MAQKKTSINEENSRYVQGGETFIQPTRLTWWERKSIPRADDDTVLTITPKYHKRPDLLAYDLYGTSTLAWLVLQYNTIVDINLEFVKGKEITVPSRSRVIYTLLDNQSGGTIDNTTR